MLKSILTAERPTVLEADVLARYHFAARYCKGKKVLDVGTGLGMGAKYIADKGAKLVLGIDYSNDTIKSNNSSNKNRKVQFKYCNVYNLKEIEEKFDVIVAFEILEHLEIGKVGAFIESVHNLLKPNGVLLLTTPNGMNTNYLFGRPYNPYHVKEYTSKDLVKLLKPLFTRIKIKGLVNRNKFYLDKQKEIRKPLVYKLVYFLGHFRFVRELVPFIPREIKHIVTGERMLPRLSIKDYFLSDNMKNSPGLFVYAKKK